MDHAETSIFPDNQSAIDQNGIPIQKVSLGSLLLLLVRTESIGKYISNYKIGDAPILFHM